MRRIFFLVVVLAILLSIVGWLSTLAIAIEYTFTTIDFPGAPSAALGINNEGKIVGFYNYYSNWDRGFLKDGPNYTAIDFPGSMAVQATGINNYGNIVGKNNEVGFVKIGETYTTFEVVPGASRTEPSAINDAGQIVGSYATTVYHGFLKDGNNYSTFDFPGAVNTFATGMNNNQIVGYYTDSSTRSHAYLKEGENYTSFEVPGAYSTYFTGMNGNQIVGYYRDASGRHGFLFDGLTYDPLIFPEAADTIPFGINGNGEIVGTYRTGSNDYHAFLATPVPEPSTILLLGSGLIGILGFRRKFKK